MVGGILSLVLEEFSMMEKVVRQRLIRLLSKTKDGSHSGQRARFFFCFESADRLTEESLSHMAVREEKVLQD